MVRSWIYRWLAMLSSLATFLGASNSDASAQNSDVSLSLGASVAGGSIPNALNPTCGNSAGREGFKSVGWLLILSSGRAALEGRMARHWGREYLCSGIILIPDAGVHTMRSSRLPVGAFTTTDTRLRLTFGSYTVGLGGGWAWSKDVPYVTSSVGVSGAYGPVRFGADFELTAFRIPWDSRTERYDEDGFVVQVLSERSYFGWETAPSLLFVFEVPLYPRPKNPEQQAR